MKAEFAQIRHPPEAQRTEIQQANKFTYSFVIGTFTAKLPPAALFAHYDNEFANELGWVLRLRFLPGGRQTHVYCKKGEAAVVEVNRILDGSSQYDVEVSSEQYLTFYCG